MVSGVALLVAVAVACATAEPQQSLAPASPPLRRRRRGRLSGSPVLRGTRVIVPSEAASAAGAAKRARPAPSGVLGLRVALNVFAWWALNVVFNLCNKICLNTWPHPWALATTHLAVGSACMLPLWLPLPRPSSSGGISWRSVRQPPSLTAADMRAFLPVVALLATGHVTSTLAPAFGTVAFSNIIKTAEPLFTCAFSALLLGQTFPLPVYRSLLPVVFGVCLASASEAHPFSAIDTLP